MAVAPLPQQNGVAHANGVTAEEPVVLSLGEDKGHKQQSRAPAQQNCVAHSNGLATEDAVVISLEEGRLHTHRDWMIGTHQFGQRTHAGVQQRHYRAVKYVGARTIRSRGLRVQRRASANLLSTLACVTLCAVSASILHQYVISCALLTTFVLAGKIGWIAKGIVYALIGGLCCRAAVDGGADVDASPQVCAALHTL